MGGGAAVAHRGLSQAVSARVSGRGQDRPASGARRTSSATVGRLTRTLWALLRSRRPHAHVRRQTARTGRLANRGAGICSSLSEVRKVHDPDGGMSASPAAPRPLEGWQGSTGISGSFQPESVATFDWHRWQRSTGISGHLRAEYARVTVGAEMAQPEPAPIGTVRMGAEVRRRGHLARAAARGAGAGSQASPCGWRVRPAKGCGSRLCWRRGGVGGGGVGGAGAQSRGHTPWSMRHTHTRATSTNWEKKRSGTMAKPPHISAEMRVFSLVFQWQE
jgi:hypothetical protein